MSTITKVAVVGASGNLGPLVVKALLDVGFEVTAVTRQESKATFSSNVVVKRADLSSVGSVTEVVKGHEAVVSTVSRFVPSEFGVNTREARDTKFGRFVASKITTLDYLIELSEKRQWFSWTGICTGAFFDWGLVNGFFGFDLKTQNCTLFDSGNEPFSGTNVAFIGKCFLTVASFTTTQNEVLRVIEEETGSKFAITNVKTSHLEKIGEEKAARNDPTAFVEFLLQYVFADGANQAVAENSAVTVLGLEEESLRTTIKAAIAALLQMKLLGIFQIKQMF
ncbi:hypothetical protein BGZ61DRAFT_499871 [Ilyonectria robusta]|uniref:uncharacterized protein n=1 Tax=Ilyonectria robusta TaxID=1079257 RepID=UPI001E8DDA33|nr:uncharacterized protein BGZ61DRAFT_499871 [Ilyonectria robusta]KAH8658994.1 hypothetical protein BGZ61DRAFT_499871 [Ilyonectria robusta]